MTNHHQPYLLLFYVHSQNKNLYHCKSKHLKSAVLKYKVFIFFFFTLLSSVSGQINGLELLQGKKSQKLKFSYARGFILVDVRYAGFIPLKFIFDTGAQNTIFFDRFTAEIVNVQYDRVIQVTGSDLSSSVAARIARGVSLKLNDCPEVKRDVIVLEEDFIQMSEIIGEQVHGIIGADFFKGLIVEINFKKQYLNIHDSRYFDHSTLKNHTLLETRFAESKPYINATATMSGGQKTVVKLLMDTGASISMLLHNDTDPSLVLPPHVIRGNLGKGISGNLTGYVGRINHLSVSGFEFPNMLSYFQEYDTSAFPDTTAIKRNGILGNFILDRFHVVIDYLNEAVYFKPEKKYNRNISYDRSGLVVYAHGRDLKQFIVNDVIEGSPAYEAGIRPDDVITKLCFSSAANLTLDKINSILSGREGKKIKVRVQRKGQSLKFEFRLRELL